MATDARKLVETIRQELAAVSEQIRNHPYIATLEKGRLPREALTHFAGHQYHIIGSDLRSLALLVSRQGHLSGRAYLLGMLQGEAAAFEACLEFARALGLEEEQLKGYEPRPGGQAYAAFVAWLSLYGSAAELAAAFLVNFAAWGANCGRMNRALKEKYGLAEEDLAFFRLFAGTPPSFETDSLKVIEDGLARGIEPRLIRRAARLLQGYELLYWDTLREL